MNAGLLFFEVPSVKNLSHVVCCGNPFPFVAFFRNKEKSYFFFLLFEAHFQDPFPLSLFFFCRVSETPHGLRFFPPVFSAPQFPDPPFLARV